MSEATLSNTKHVVALTGLSSGIKPGSQADLWIVYLPKGDRAVDQNAEDGTPTKLRVNPSALSAKRMEAALRQAQGKRASNQPYTDYNHDDKEASGRPLKFAWHDDLGVIGLTRRTLQAVERTDQPIRPSSRKPSSPHRAASTPKRAEAGRYPAMNCGGFVNRPLFGDATSLSAAAHLPQELVAADPNEVELVSAAQRTSSSSFQRTDRRKLCAHYQLDASTVTEAPS